jgi:uncharacterized protein (DUF983 family)
MLKSTKVYSVLANKCPYCHEGSFFINNNAYNLATFHKMNDACSVCGEDFKKEPGFYYGAMYMSYGLTVAVAVVWAILLNVFNKYDAFTYVITFAPLIIALFPIMYRSARLGYINVFVHYNKDFKRLASK